MSKRVRMTAEQAQDIHVERHNAYVRRLEAEYRRANEQAIARRAHRRRYPRWR